MPSKVAVMASVLAFATPVLVEADETPAAQPETSRIEAEAAAGLADALTAAAGAAVGTALGVGPILPTIPLSEQLEEVPDPEAEAGADAAPASPVQAEPQPGSSGTETLAVIHGDGVTMVEVPPGGQVVKVQPVEEGEEKPATPQPDPEQVAVQPKDREPVREPARGPVADVVDEALTAAAGSAVASPAAEPFQTAAPSEETATSAASAPYGEGEAPTGVTVRSFSNPEPAPETGQSLAVIHRDGLTMVDVPAGAQVVKLQNVEEPASPEAPATAAAPSETVKAEQSAGWSYTMRLLAVAAANAMILLVAAFLV